MSKKHKFSIKNINLCNQIINDYKNNKTVEDISKNFLINRKSVYKVLKQNDVLMKGERFNLLGRKYGKLSVIKFDSFDNNGKRKWLCSCECGKTIVVRAADLKSGKNISCGCFRNEQSSSFLKKYRKDIKDKNLKFHNFCGYKDLSGIYLGSLKHSAIKRNLTWDVTPEYLYNLYIEQNKKCAISGLDIYLDPIKNNKQTASLDRKNSKLGYTKENVQWLHIDVNYIKMDFDQEYFIKLCSVISDFNKNSDGLLYGTRVYLAGNLEYGENNYSWRNKIYEDLVKIGIKIICPTKKILISEKREETEEDRINIKNLRENQKFNEVENFAKDIISRDLRAVDLSDFIIVRIDIKLPTFGTIHEIVNAKEQHKPILVLIEDKTKLPIWLCGLIDQKNVFEKYEDLISYLYKINNYEIELDTKKWKLLDKSLR